MIKAQPKIQIGYSPWAEDERRATGKQVGNHSYCVEIINDPDYDCGFRPGAQITQEELRLMLLGCCFTLGTRLRHPYHGEMQVVSYTYPVARAMAVTIKTIQGLRGDGYMLIPCSDTSRHGLVRIGINGHNRMR